MDQEADTKPPNNLLTFPPELLVYIFSFVTSARDRLNLRCVSRMCSSIYDSEAPSLWREFV